MPSAAACCGECPREGRSPRQPSEEGTRLAAWPARPPCVHGARREMLIIACVSSRLCPEGQRRDEKTRGNGGMPGFGGRAKRKKGRNEGFGLVPFYIFLKGDR